VGPHSAVLLFLQRVAGSQQGLEEIELETARGAEPKPNSTPCLTLTRRWIEAFDKLLETTKWLMGYAGHQAVALLLAALNTVLFASLVYCVRLCLKC